MEGGSINGDSRIVSSKAIFTIEKVDRSMSAESKKQSEIDRVMSMDIKYKPFEEEMKEGQKRRRGKKAVILKYYCKESKDKINKLTKEACMAGVSKI